MGSRTARTLWQTLTLTFALSLGITTSTTAAALSESQQKSGQSFAQTSRSDLTSLAQSLDTQTEAEIRLAQSFGSCYELIQEGGTYIQEAPTVYSSVLAPIYYGENVRVAPGGTEYWTYITEPISGYVWTNWLVPCQTISQLPPREPALEDLENCRLVIADEGIPVWPSPAESGSASGYVASGESVIIENLGFDGWVPISDPVFGYVQAENLTFCN